MPQPIAPKEHDPTYTSWLAIANANGMTVEQLFASMYPDQPAALPVPTVSAPQTSGVGMYEGQGYDPGGSGFNVPSALLQGWEAVVARDMGLEADQLQGQMDAAYKGLANAQIIGSQVETEFYTNQILQIRSSYEQLVQKAQTGAGGLHSWQRGFATNLPAGAIGELGQELPQGYNINLPTALTEAPGGVDLSYMPATSGGGPRAGTTYTPTDIYPNQTPQTSSLVPGLAQRGGMNMFNPLSQVALKPPSAPVSPTAAPIDKPSAAGAGYATFAHLQEAKGEYPRVLSGGTPYDLTSALGKSGSEVQRVYNENVWQDSQLAVQRVDLGQGEQDYIVRRDAYGNVTSFTPASSSSYVNRSIG